MRHCSVPFLSSGVPNLSPYSSLGLLGLTWLLNLSGSVWPAVDVNDLCGKLNSDSCRTLHLELVFRVAPQQVRLSNAWVSNQHHFQEKVVLI